MEKITQEEFMRKYTLSIEEYLKSDEYTFFGIWSPKFDFSNLDLSDLYLAGFDLREADFSNSILEKVSLINCALSGSTFNHACMDGCHIRNCDARNCSFEYADIKNSDVSFTNFEDSNFYCSVMSNMRYSENVNWADSDLGFAIDPPYVPMACPSEGSFFGYKRCCSDRIVKLEIPEDAKRSSATGRKCRCDKAKVVSITDRFGNPFYQAVSLRDNSFVYTVGEYVSVNNFNENRYVECSAGIHFFMGKQEAIDYWY